MNLDQFKNYLLLNCGAKKSADCHYTKLVDFFRHNTEFTQESVNTFLVSKRDVWKATTTNVYIAAFKWYAKFLKVTLEFPKLKKVNVSAKVYKSEAEVEDILGKCNMAFRNERKVQTILTVMFELGLRPKELFQLKREDFNFETKEVVIKNTKTHVDRSLPLSDNTASMIQMYFKLEEEKESAFNINFLKLNYIFAKINERLRLKNKISPYTFRRSMAKNLLSKGLKISELKEMMGHSDIASTMCYLTVTADDARISMRAILNKKGK